MNQSFINRPSKELIEALKKFSVPELCDGCEIYHAMDYQIKPQLGRSKIVGPAFTVDVPMGESKKVAEAIREAESGDVIVISAKGNCNSACWGDMRSFQAEKKGITGVVIDGAFRDLEGCEEIGVPIFARALTCGASGKREIGTYGVPISCGGVVVHPGDIIVGDVNGVCVIQPDEAKRVIARAIEKRKKEEEARKECQ